ncbi:hypothetical protein VKT23_017920 [Stygiomarasmius scandens]|uniref:mitogen-activated protein kinase kinase kinase n=1 Tax=Marasmiellus scandens TaxID=2682957 RepID=A0ABR1IQL2_9AGAR
MATLVEEGAQSRRVMQPKYEFDPDAVYPDPQVQAWATYYAEGGLDPAGAIYFTSVPNLENRGESSSRPILTVNTDFLERPSTPTPKSVQPEPEDFDYLRATYGIATTLPTKTTVKYDFEPSRPDELAVKGEDRVCVLHTFDDGWTIIRKGPGEGKRGMVPTDCLLLGDTLPILKLPGPRTPSSLPRLSPVRSSVPEHELPESQETKRRKSRRSVLGLLELLNVTKRPGQRMRDDLIPSPVSEVDPPKSEPTLRSVLKKRLSTSKDRVYFAADAPPDASSQSTRKVRFDSSENLEFQFSTYGKSSSNASTRWDTELDDSEEPFRSSSVFLTDDSPTLPSPNLPPSYEELESLANTPPILPPFAQKSSIASSASYGNEKRSFDLEQSGSTARSTPTLEEEKTLVEVYTQSVSIDISSQDVFTAHAVSTVAATEGVLALGIIYRNFLSFLIGEVSPADTLWTTLQEYLVSVQSLEPVSSLVQSRDFRANLLQVASALDIPEDHRVREALQKDEHEIAEVLHSISQSDVSRQAVLALEGDDAQKFLDVVQDVLDKGYLLSHEENSRARRLLVRLSETCDKLPSSLFIKGVERPDEQATFGGGFGDVFRADYQGRHVALKRMRIFQRDPGLPNIRRRFCREALFWQHLRSTFIVPFLGIDAETFPSFLCMVSPWMKHGTVLKHLADYGRAGVDKRLHEVAQGLAYLHSQKIVHGDLRGANILINDDWQACLTDFGLTVFNDATVATFTSRREGSVRWMAPELHVPESFGLDRFRLTPETDIYSFGCVCLELYTGRAPFADILHDSAVMLKVIQGIRPERPTGGHEMSDQLWRMVEMCWSQHFADRLKTNEVLEFTRSLSDPEAKTPVLPVFSEVPKSLLPSEDGDETRDWDKTDAKLEAALIEAGSQARPLYLQPDISLSKDSLYIEPFPPFPRFNSRPFPAYPPSADQLVDLDNSDEEDDVDDGGWSPFVEQDSTSLAIPLSSQEKHRDIPEELKDYWDIVHELDSALDVDFALDFSLAKPVVSATPNPSVAVSQSYLSVAFTFILAIAFALYLVLYLCVIVYLIIGGLLVQPVVIRV